MAGRKAFAQSAPCYGGPFLLCIQAGGGWDTTMFFDPKAPFNGVVLNKAYEQPASRGPFRYAPVDFVNGSFWLHSPEHFLGKYQNRMLLLNGVDMQTNAHPVGEQIAWGGHLSREYPAIGALLALKATQSVGASCPVPCAFLTDGGGYTRTSGLISPSRVSASGVRDLAYDNRFPGERDPNRLLRSEKTHQNIQKAQEKRIQLLSQQLSMPESKQALERYNKAMLDKSGLEALAAALPSTPITLEALRPGGGNAIDTLLQQTELALSGFRSGTMAAASVSLGSFDSHSSNDVTQRRLLGYLFVLLEYVLDTADALGLSDKLTVVVGSEFSRTPEYNSLDNGKDHWNTSSYMLFGPGIRGGRVLGATAGNQYPEHVNPKNPAALLSEESGGIVLKPGHVHHALRRALGLSEFNAAYGFVEDDISLF